MRDQNRRTDGPRAPGTAGPNLPAAADDPSLFGRTALTSMFPLRLNDPDDEPPARPMPGTPRAAAVRSEAGSPGTVR